MKKNSSKKVGNVSNTIIDSKKKISNDKQEQIEKRILELDDFEIEALFESGKINQEQYEYILNLRKKKKRKKTEKEKFEERIRCDNSVIETIINIGRKFRVQDLLARGKFEEAKKINVNNEFIKEEEQEYFIDARTRDKNREQKMMNKNSKSRGRDRGRERDSR